MPVPAQSQEFRPVSQQAPLQISNKARSVRFPGRILTA
jgi:hypothetical protein